MIRIMWGFRGRKNAALDGSVAGSSMELRPYGSKLLSNGRATIFILT